MGALTGPQNVAVVLLDSLNRPMLGAYGGDEFATPNLDRFADRRSLRSPRHRVAAVHARPPRHPLWGTRFPVEAVGVDRTLGAADHASAEPCGGHHGARHRPSSSVRVGRGVQITNGRDKYVRGAVEQNYPLSMWSNRWSTMPVHVAGFTELPPPDGRAWLDRMPGSDVPVIRQPYRAGDMLPFWVGGRNVDRHFLFDLDDDPDEQEDRSGERRAADMADLLREALRSVDAPDDQFERLGLS